MMINSKILLKSYSYLSNFILEQILLDQKRSLTKNFMSQKLDVQTPNFEEVWQYGSHEGEDIDYIQDGIAPQCAVPGLEFDSQSDSYGRIRFLGLEKNKNFLDAHYGANYDWVLSNISNQDAGYVKKR